MRGKPYWGMMYALLIIIVMNSQSIYPDEDNADLMPHFMLPEQV